MFDPLSVAIDELGLRKAAFRRVSARGAWCIRYAADQQGVHLIERGGCTLRAAGLELRLEAGDLAIIPRSLPHELLASSGGRPRVTPASVLASHDREGPFTIEGPGRGGETELACGVFELDAKDHPMLATLPPVIHLSPARARETPRLASYVQALLSELDRPAAGSAAVVVRLSEVLLVEALRGYSALGAECSSGGWFRGLQDASLARALSAFHSDIAGTWTVESLARVAGQSRSAFARRFNEVLGEPPLAFVTRWRLFHARRLLRTTQASLDEISARVGYGSASAFSVAFVRDQGQTPGEYRAQHREREVAGSSGHASPTRRRAAPA